MYTKVNFRACTLWVLLGNATVHSNAKPLTALGQRHATGIIVLGYDSSDGAQAISTGRGSRHDASRHRLFFCFFLSFLVAEGACLASPVLLR